MSNYNDVIKGYRIPAQIRLDAKSAVQSEAVLSNLGTGNNLAFTYYEGLKVYCKNEKKTYIWREVIGLEQGLLLLNFTYPTYSPIDGINYSNKNFNFFSDIIQVELSPLQVINEGNGNGIIKRGRFAGSYGNIGLDAVDLSINYYNSNFSGATGEASFASGSDVIASGHSSNAGGVLTEASGSGSHAEGSGNWAQGNNSHAEGVGTVAISLGSHTEGSGTRAKGSYSHAEGVGSTSESYGEHSGGIWSTIYTPASTTIFVATDRLLNYGNGTTADTRSDAFTILKNGLAILPSVTNALIIAASGKAVVTKEYLNSVLPTPVVIINDQKIITTSYTLVDSDNDYTIFIENGATPITITVSGTLKARFQAGFIQRGTADVTFDTIGGAVLNTAVGNKIKGLNYQVYLEKVLTTLNFHLLGNTKL